VSSDRTKFFSTDSIRFSSNTFNHIKKVRIFVRLFCDDHDKLPLFVTTIDCTYVLAVLAQACHRLVDPDVLRPALMYFVCHLSLSIVVNHFFSLFRAVVDRFVSDKSRPEVMSVG
jgi:hypothetical protein